MQQSVQTQGYGVQVRGWNPGMGKRFFVYPKHPDGLWGSPGLLVIAHRVTFAGIKRPERGVDKWSPSTAVAINEWSYTPISSIRNNGVDRNNFTFTFTFSSESYVKWATVVVQCHKISNATEIMHNECSSTANADWPLTLVCRVNKEPEVKLFFSSPRPVDRFKGTMM